MTGSRPFASYEALCAAAAGAWRGLAKEDWLEAFAAHPRIGAATEDRRASAEQSGARSASAATLEELRRLNREYESKFGFIYIVCASGKSADQMLALLQQRIANPPEREIAIAAEEQLAITMLRIAKIGTEPL